MDIFYPVEVEILQIRTKICLSSREPRVCPWKFLPNFTSSIFKTISIDFPKFDNMPKLEKYRTFI